MRKSESIELIRQAFVLSVASVIQVVAFEFIYEGAVEIYEAFFRQLNPAFGFGMQSAVSLYVLGVLAALNAIIVTSVQRVEIKWLSGTAATIIWAAYWSNISLAVPNHFFLIVLTGMMSFHIGLLFCDLLPTTGRAERSLR